MVNQTLLNDEERQCKDVIPNLALGSTAIWYTEHAQADEININLFGLVWNAKVGNQ